MTEISLSRVHPDTRQTRFLPPSRISPDVVTREVTRAFRNTLITSPYTPSWYQRRDTGLNSAYLCSGYVETLAWVVSQAKPSFPGPSRDRSIQSPRLNVFPLFVLTILEW